jgi:hypothetical protein
MTRFFKRKPFVVQISKRVNQIERGHLQPIINLEQCRRIEALSADILGFGNFCFKIKTEKIMVRERAINYPRMLANRGIGGEAHVKRGRTGSGDIIHRHHFFVSELQSQSRNHKCPLN